MLKNKRKGEEFIPLKHVKLPKPLPQSYLGKRNFLLRYKDELDLVEFGEKPREKRYFLKQNDVDQFVKRKLKQ